MIGYIVYRKHFVPIVLNSCRNIKSKPFIPIGMKQVCSVFHCKDAVYVQLSVSIRHKNGWKVTKCTYFAPRSNHKNVARILAIDYGKKRTGLAVTDPLKIIATGLASVETKELIGYLKKYMLTEPVEKVIVGYPLNFDESPTDATPLVDKFIIKFGNVFPALPVEKVDERMTSKMASQAIAQMGLKKKEREEKGLIDTVSAVIMLQEYLG